MVAIREPRSQNPLKDRTCCNCGGTFQGRNASKWCPACKGPKVRPEYVGPVVSPTEGYYEAMIEARARCVELGLPFPVVVRNLLRGWMREHEGATPL